MDSNALLAAIASQSLPTPSPSLVNNLLTSRSPPPPLPSLVATAKARLLACDLASSTLIDRGKLASLPADIANSSVKETRLQRDVYVQVVDIENLSLSRWEQIEELEAIEKGERTRGRQVVRLTDDGEANASEQRAGNAQAGRNSTHRLVVQDHVGTRAYSVELSRIPAIGVGKLGIGCKLLLRAGMGIARGTLLLTPENCVLLGGRIDAFHETWMSSRMESLKEAIGAGDTRSR